MSKEKPTLEVDRILELYDEYGTTNATIPKSHQRKLHTFQVNQRTADILRWTLETNKNPADLFNTAIALATYHRLAASVGRVQMLLVGRKRSGHELPTFVTRINRRQLTEALDTHLTRAHTGHLAWLEKTQRIDPDLALYNGLALTAAVAADWRKELCLVGSDGERRFLVTAGAGVFRGMPAFKV